MTSVKYCISREQKTSSFSSRREEWCGVINGWHECVIVEVFTAQCLAVMIKKSKRLSKKNPFE